MNPLLSFVQLSDLHFIGELTEKGRSLKIKGPKSHSFTKLDALSARLFEIQYYQQRRIDLFILTGDIATDGSTSSFNTALEYIREKDIYRYTPGRRIARGLGIDRECRIILPGNHDRFGGYQGLLPAQRGNQDLELVFQLPQRYPYAVGFPARTSTEDATTNASIIFFVVDSTLVQDDREDSLTERIARGRVDEGECHWLREQAYEIEAKGEILGLDGKTLKVDYDSAVKVLLLHHHPILPTEQDTHNLSSRLTSMDNGRLLIEACYAAQVQLVLFGHQHLAYHSYERGTLPDSVFEAKMRRAIKESKPVPEKQHAIHFYCAASASEYSEKKNGFYLFEVFSDSFTVESYTLNSTERWPGDCFELTSRTRDRFALKERSASTNLR